MMMSPADKPLVILSGEIKTPPLTASARVEAGYLLRRLQKGGNLGHATFASDAVGGAALP